jgi:hypothetical protein
MKINFSYKQNEDKLVNRYVSAPLVTNKDEITKFVFKTLEEMVVASGNKQIDITVYDVFNEPAKFTFLNHKLMMVKP